VLATLWLVAMVGGFASLLDKAVRMGEMSFIAPFLFTGILLAVFWGYLIWNEIPTLTMATGIMLIIGSGLYVLTGHRVARRKLQTMQPH